MLDSTDIQKLARKHGVSGDPAAIVALVRAVEHLTVGAIVTRAAISFANRYPFDFRAILRLGTSTPGAPLPCVPV
ncbi:hypothetical protein [Paraburkholderia sp. J94]|uniref:hypothetical protein n=1 Tax=Paraburkholderia sp. J94 TaxID=2805441 RepID=UPI002AB02DE5|nr:hypothetical protein [Paraburkholderia sp. J94]